MKSFLVEAKMMKMMMVITMAMIIMMTKLCIITVDHRTKFVLDMPNIRQNAKCSQRIVMV